MPAEYFKIKSKNALPALAYQEFRKIIRISEIDYQNCLAILKGETMLAVAFEARLYKANSKFSFDAAEETGLEPARDCSHALSKRTP